MANEDPPAYEPPGPEITGQSRDVEDNKAAGETFKDEPAAGEYSDDGDPAKCNFSPLTIIILVILNLLALGAVGYLIWYAVDQATNTTAPTRAPSPPPTPAPSRSMAPSNVPSMSNAPTQVVSLAPTPTTTPAPTTSSAPTGTFSLSPTFGTFMCNLCGPGKTMSTANLASSVSFGSRVSRTCQELLTDQNNGDILEEQCIALYPSIDTTCGCVSTSTIGARDTTAIFALARNKVGTVIDTRNTDENTALGKLLDPNTDTYFSSNKASLSDDEVIQRYLMILAYYQLNIESLLSSRGNYATDECTWSTNSCQYGQITTAFFDSSLEAAASTPVLPTDLINITYMESISVTGYNFASSIPATLPTNDYLVSFALTNNGLTGTIPNAMFELRSLTSLNLSGNTLTGDLGAKTKIKQLSRLTYLDLGTNAVDGTLPTCELATPPATVITDCPTEVTCTCCTC